MGKNEGFEQKENTVLKERRRKPDLVVRLATVLSLISWLVTFSVWIVLDRASPEKETMFSRFFGITVRSYWNSSLLQIAWTMLVVSLGTCILAFIFNILRKRRKTDKYKLSVIIIGVINIAGIIFFLSRFGLVWA